MTQKKNNAITIQYIRTIKDDKFFHVLLCDNPKFSVKGFDHDAVFDEANKLMKAK